MRRVMVLAKVLVAGLMLAMIIGPAKPASAYRACTSSETAYCSQMGGPIVICSAARHCFQNMCFAQCSGFSPSNCYEAVTCQDPPPLN